MIELKADVVVERVAVEVHGAVPIAKLSLEGIRLGAVSKRTCTAYAVVLQGLKVQDLDPATSYAMVSFFSKQLNLPADFFTFTTGNIVLQNTYNLSFIIENSAARVIRDSTES